MFQNKFAKWPFFTIWTAPSTVKSKHNRTKTATGVNKVKWIIGGGKYSFASVGSHSNSRPRSNSKKHK